MSEEAEALEQVRGQPCPMCHTKNLTLMERDLEVPFFGKLMAFSMSCTNCKFHKADVEVLEGQEPCKYTLEIDGEEDLNIRIVRSSQATVKLPHITTITPGPASQGYVTNVEGILKRVQREIQSLRDSEEDPAAKKKAKNLLKKLQKIMWGHEKQKLIIEDPSGNSAIVSEKAVKEKLKK